MRAFFRFYKWQFIFSMLVLVCLIFIFSSVTMQTSPDLSIAYVGQKYVNLQKFNDSKEELERLLHDATEDGKKKASFVAYTADLQKDLDEQFSQMIESEEYTIFIASKETFQAYRPKTAFVDASEYVTYRDKEYDVLTDSSGRIYATSITDNSLAERLGIVDPTGLYIAALSAKEGEETTAFMKNGRNIASYIIDSKETYK